MILGKVCPNDWWRMVEVVTDWGENHNKHTNILSKHMGVDLCIAMMAQCNMNGQVKVMMISRMRGNSY